MENGKIAVARTLTNDAACGSTEFHVLRPNDGVSAEYLWRGEPVLTSSDLQEELNRLSGLSPVLRYMRRKGLPLTPKKYRGLNYLGVENPQPDEADLEIIQFLTMLQASGAAVS